MRPPRTRKIATGVLTLVALAAAWFYFAPTGLGGATSYVVTDGISMEPRFHAGDLALVRSQSSYRVGEIVAYHSNNLHTVVLHRIVALDGANYVFKGDHNNFSDFEHPARSQLMGALWLHVAGVGGNLASVRSPALIGALVGLSVLLFAGAAFTHRRRLRRRRRRATERPRPRASAARRGPVHPPAVAVLTCAALASLGILALGVIAFARPTRTPQSFAVHYRQSASLAYSATATPGPVYPGNRAVTGDPLFTHVLRTVAFRFAYHFRTDAPHALGGRASLVAQISSTSGWRATLPVGVPTGFHGDGVVLDASLDLSSLQALLHQVENSTAVSGTYTLTLVPRVDVAGQLAGLPLRTVFSPAVHFSLDQYELEPVVSASGLASAGGAPAASPFTPASEGSAAGRRDQTTLLSLGIASVSVGTARLLAGVGLLALALSTLLALILVRPRKRSEAAAIRARYGRLIVPVACVRQAPGVAVIDVEDMDALVNIAEHYERSILHESVDGEEAFWVTDESGQFRYVLGAAPAALPEPYEDPYAEQGYAAHVVDPDRLAPAEEPTMQHAEPARLPQRGSMWRMRRRVSV
jgi:signal peptidase I